MVPFKDSMVSKYKPVLRAYLLARAGGNGGNGGGHCVGGDILEARAWLAAAKGTDVGGNGGSTGGNEVLPVKLDKRTDLHG